MSNPSTFVVVGASLAGAKAAEALRAEGFDGRLVLVGEEPQRPYERPPLSKGYLRGEADPDKLYVHDEGFYAEHDIELRTETRIVAIDRAGSEVVDADGERIAYDRLLLATGAAARRLRIPGADLDRIFSCATWPTPIACAPPSPTPGGWRWWAGGGSAPRWRRRSATPAER